MFYLLSAFVLIVLYLLFWFGVLVAIGLGLSLGIAWLVDKFNPDNKQHKSKDL